MKCRFGNKIECKHTHKGYEMGSELEYPDTNLCIACRLAEIVELYKTYLTM